MLEGLQVKTILCNASESVPLIAVVIPQVFQFSFCNSPEHAMPLSHRCCISSSSVFIAPLFAKVIRVNCNLKYALAVWCLPAHGVGRIFFITVMVFGHYPIATRLWRDYDAIRFLTTRLHLAYSPVPYLVGCLAAKELHGASLISLAITLNSSRMSVKYMWLESACVQVRENAREKCSNLL